MKELVSLLVKQLKVDEAQALGGAAILFKAARDKMGASQFDEMMGKVRGVSELIGQAPPSGGLGKLFGGLASAVGGNDAAIVANIVSGFGRLGLTPEHAKSFAPVILEFLRGKIGKGAVEALEKALRS